MALRHQIRNVTLRAFPRMMLEFLSWRSQRLIMRLERDRGLVAASVRFIESFGRKVLRGPFAGMKYPERTLQERNLIPKLVGSYEGELHEILAKIKKKSFSAVVNVGTADGYYTVGLALAFSGVPVVGFDTDAWARRATAELAKENNAWNVTVRKMCTPELLAVELPRDALLMSDCEGYEEVLLDPAVTRNLSSATILVELHEQWAPNIIKLLESRFNETHSISLTWATERKPSDYPELGSVDEAVREESINEGRHSHQAWAYLEPLPA